MEKKKHKEKMNGIIREGGQRSNSPEDQLEDILECRREPEE